MKKILIMSILFSNLFSGNIPKMEFKESFYIENKCQMIDLHEKEFNPTNCFFIKNKPFKLDYCLTVDKAIMCISSKDRKNYLLKTETIINNNKIIIQNNIIEVNEIVYKDTVN